MKGHETVTRTTRKRAAAAQPSADDAPAPHRTTRSRAGRPPRAPVPTLATVAEDAEEEEGDEETEAAGGHKLSMPVCDLLTSVYSWYISTVCLGQEQDSRLECWVSVWSCIVCSSITSVGSG